MGKEGIGSEEEKNSRKERLEKNLTRRFIEFLAPGV
jgi:hypothetical protein